MLIERVKSYEGEEGPVKSVEEELERYRNQLRKMAKYGLNGLGACTLRDDLGKKICTAKHNLLATGAYQEAKDFKEYRGD